MIGSVRRSVRTIVPVGLLLAASLVMARSALSTATGTGLRSNARDTGADLSPTPLIEGVPAPAGFSGPTQPETDSAPTGRADVTQQWFAHGRWWAVLLDGGSQEFHIWTLDGVDGPWVDTGTLVDERTSVAPDVAWTGDALYVVASGTRSYRNQAARISRFRYDRASTRWVLDADFPVAITQVGVAAPLLTVTADGTLWVAFLDADGHLQVTRSRTGGLTWSAPAAPPGPAMTLAAGGFGATAVADELHLVWRPADDDDRLFSTVRRGTPDDGTWTTTAHVVYGIGGAGPLSVRDGASVGIDALLVTAQLVVREDSTDTSTAEILLIQLSDTEPPQTAVVSRTSDDLEDPRLMLDPEHRRVQVIAASGDGRGALYLKQADAEQVLFEAGTGAMVLNLPVAGTVAHPVVPDQQLDGSTGAVVLATSPLAARYATSLLPMGSEPVIEPYEGRGTDGTSTLVRDTFDGIPLGSPAPQSWYSNGSEEGPAELVRLGSGARGLQLSADDPSTSRERCRDFPTVDDRTVTIAADVVVQGGGGADARLLTVRSDAGVVLSARLSSRGDVGWRTPSGRSRSLRVAPGAPLRVTATLDPLTRTYRMTVTDLATGAVALDLAPTPWLDGSSPAVTSACMTPPEGPSPSSLAIDTLSVTTR